MKNNRRAIEDRQRELLRMLLEQGEISVEEMAERFSVSQMTIRRDLSLLSDRGLLLRKHGSAQSLPYGEQLNREDRDLAQYRDAISKYAASLVDDGDRLFINGSRTALNLLNYVGDKKVQVVTNNGWALDGKYSGNVQIRMTGGTINEHLMVGEYAVESLIGLSATKLFVGCAAVYWNGEFRYDIPSEIGINEMMVSRTDGPIYVLADHTKLRGKEEQLMVYGRFRYPVPVTLVTNKEADAEILRTIRETGIRVRIVSLDGQLITDNSL